MVVPQRILAARDRRRTLSGAMRFAEVGNRAIEEANFVRIALQLAGGVVGRKGSERRSCLQTAVEDWYFSIPQSSEGAAASAPLSNSQSEYSLPFGSLWSGQQAKFQQKDVIG